MHYQRYEELKTQGYRCEIQIESSWLSYDLKYRVMAEFIQAIY